MANIDSAFSSEFLSVNDNVLIVNGSINPSTGLGFEAPTGSIYLRTGFGEVYVKSGPGDIDWSLIRSGVINFDDLGDVILTSPSTGNTIVFDGVKWVNQSVAGTTDQLVKISSADTTAGYLQPKLVAGTNINITRNNPGANETLTISATIASSPDEKVKVSATDTTSGFLLSKLGAGANISFTQNLPGANETLILSVTGLSPADVGLSNIPNSLQVINAGGAVSIQEDILANRPAFGSAGRLFLDTNTNILYRDTGVSWVPVGNLGTVTSVSATGSTGLDITGSPITNSGTLTLTLDLGLQNLATHVGTGLLVSTGVDTWTARALTAGSGKVVVTDGSGVLGNPTIDIGTLPIDGLSDVTITGTPSDNATLSYNLATNQWNWVPAAPGPPPGGTATVQLKWGPIAAISGTASISLSNTAPLISAGTQAWTQVIDIQSSLSTIRVATDLVISSSTNSMEFAIVIFRTVGAVSTAIGATLNTTGNNTAGHAMSFVVYDTPNYLGNVTYSARIGKASGSGTWYVNQRSGYSNLWGGLLTSNAYSVEEIGVV